MRDILNIVLSMIIVFGSSESRSQSICTQEVQKQESPGCKNEHVRAADNWASQFPKQRKFWKIDSISTREDLDVFTKISRYSNVIVYSLAIARQSRDASLDGQFYSLKSVVSESGFRALNSLYSSGNIQIPPLEISWHLSDWSADGNLYSATLYIPKSNSSEYSLFKLIYRRDGVKWLLSDIHKSNS